MWLTGKGKWMVVITENKSTWYQLRNFESGNGRKKQKNKCTEQMRNGKLIGYGISGTDKVFWEKGKGF